MRQAERFERICLRTAEARAHLKGKSVRGALCTASGGAVDFALRLVSTIVMARLLSPEDFGLVAMVLAVTAIAEQFRDLGLTFATVQAQELSHEQVINLFWVNAAIGAGFALVACGAAPAIAAFYHDPRLVPIAIALSVNFLFGGLTVQHQALLTRQMKQAHMALVRLSAAIASFLVALTLALHHFGYWALVWREIVRIGAVAAGMWFCCAWLPGLPSRRGRIGSLLRFGTDMTLVQGVVAIVQSLDRLILGRFFGAGVVGLYRQAQQLLLVPVQQLKTPIYSVSSPGLSMLQSETERYRRYYRRILFVFAFTTLPLGLLCAIYAHEITIVLLSAKWAGSAVFISIFGLAAALRPTLDTAELVLITCGLSRRLLVISALENSFLAVLLFAGIRFGPVGVACAYLANMFILSVPKLYYCFKETPVTLGLFWNTVSVPVTASAWTVGVLLWFHHWAAGLSNAVSLFSGCALAALVYASVFLLLPQGRRQLFVLIGDVRHALQRTRASTTENPAVAAT